jgi:hypothetical protein
MDVWIANHFCPLFPNAMEGTQWQYEGCKLVPFRRAVHGSVIDETEVVPQTARAHSFIDQLAEEMEIDHETVEDNECSFDTYEERMAANDVNEVIFSDETDMVSPCHEVDETEVVQAEEMDIPLNPSDDAERRFQRNARMVNDEARTPSSFLTLPGLIDKAEAGINISRNPLHMPTKNATIICEMHAYDDIGSDGWRWIHKSGPHDKFCDSNGTSVKWFGNTFQYHTRLGRQYLYTALDPSSVIYWTRVRTRSHVANPNFVRRITQIRRESPTVADMPSVVEYRWESAEESPLHLPAHGNSIKRPAPFQPSAPAAIRAAETLITLGVPSRTVLKRVDGLRGQRQVENISAKMRRLSNPSSDDPWGHLLRMSGQTSGVSEFVQGLLSMDGQTSVWIYNMDQLKTMESVCGFGNLASTDTTYGLTAYASTFTYRNVKLLDIVTKEHPTFVGPGMVHTKEKDTTAWHHFLQELNIRMPRLVPLFSSDQDAMINKNLTIVWPTGTCLLGREHLIMNLNEKCRKLGVSSQTSSKVKAELFGPAQYGDRPPVLDAVNEEVFDSRFSQYIKEWLELGSAAVKLSRYVEGRKDVYKKRASKWAMEEVGVLEVWQQAQERKHRTLKSIRQCAMKRNPVDLVTELTQLITEEQNCEEEAIFGKGKYCLAPKYLHFHKDEHEWRMMSAEERRVHLEKFRKSGSSRDSNRVIPPFRAANDRKGAKQSTRLGRAPHSTGLSVPTSSREPLKELDQQRLSVSNAALSKPIHSSHQPPSLIANAALSQPPLQQPSRHIKYWENNEDFNLEFVSRKSTFCGACGGPIRFVAPVAGDRLVFRHAEQYMYPKGPSADKWSVTAISRTRTKNVFYHATRLCITDRFDIAYFLGMPVRQGSGIRQELMAHPLDIAHPDL